MALGLGFGLGLTKNRPPPVSIEQIDNVENLFSDTIEIINNTSDAIDQLTEQIQTFFTNEVIIETLNKIREVCEIINSATMQ